MSSTLKPYPSYKESNIPWIGMLPDSWDVVPTKRKFSRVKEVNTGMKCENRLALTKFGVIPRKLNDSEGLQTSDYEGYQIFEAGDLAFKLIDLQNIKTSRVGYVPTKGIMSPAYIRLVNQGNFNTRYAYWYFMALYWTQVFNGLGGGVRQTLGQEELGEIPLPSPSDLEQAEIANFLDAETSKIDDLMARQQELINILDEKKHILVLEAVTKGLQAKKEFIATGIDWMPLIPEGWSTSKIKNIFQIKKRIAGTLGHDVLSITQSGLKIKDLESNEGQLSMDYSKYQLVEIGDFAMNHMDLLTGYVDIAAAPGVTSPDYRVFSIRNSNLHFPKFYLLLLQISYKSKLFYPFGQGSSQMGRWRLPTDAFNEFVYPVPPYEEQKAICEYVSAQIEGIDQLIDQANKAINLLKEHRTSLIFSAVTGKIDVRNLS